MSDLDQALRRITDLEAVVREQGYRIKALEKAGDKSPVKMPEAIFDNHPPSIVDLGGGSYIYDARLDPRVGPPSLSVVGIKQFCECGRDVCRAPECPSHKTDPLGR